VTWRIPAVTSLDALSADPLQWADDAVLKAARNAETLQMISSVKKLGDALGVTAGEAIRAMSQLSKALSSSPHSARTHSIPPITRSGSR
jgi:hypothetical protein